MGLRSWFFPPLVEPCSRCKGTGYDPEARTEDDFEDVCYECLGVAKQLTDFGRQVMEAHEVTEARVEARLDARYGQNNPLDPRNSSR
jgi:hypothetical protein